MKLAQTVPTGEKIEITTNEYRKIRDNLQKVYDDNVPVELLAMNGVKLFKVGTRKLRPAEKMKLLNEIKRIENLIGL